MRAFAIRVGDLARCPRRSLLPSHWREDGTCLCAARSELDAVEAIASTSDDEEEAP